MFSIEMVDLLIGKFEVVMGRRWNVEGKLDFPAMQ
jgi:hypothetical protein